MIHICQFCNNARDCGCGDCGEQELEICTDCNNYIMLKISKERNIPLEEFGQGPLGSYFWTDKTREYQLSKK